MHSSPRAQKAARMAGSRALLLAVTACAALRPATGAAAGSKEDVIYFHKPASNSTSLHGRSATELLEYYPNGPGKKPADTVPDFFSEAFPFRAKFDFSVVGHFFIKEVNWWFAGFFALICTRFALICTRFCMAAIQRTLLWGLAGAVETRFCDDCARANDGDAVFCKACGRRLDQAAGSAPATPSAGAGGLASEDSEEQIEKAIKALNEREWNNEEQLEILKRQLSAGGYSERIQDILMANTWKNAQDKNTSLLMQEFFARQKDKARTSLDLRDGQALNQFIKSVKKKHPSRLFLSMDLEEIREMGDSILNSLTTTHIEGLAQDEHGYKVLCRLMGTRKKEKDMPTAFDILVDESKLNALAKKKPGSLVLQHLLLQGTQHQQEKIREAKSRALTSDKYARWIFKKDKEQQTSSVWAGFTMKTFGLFS